MKKRDLCIIGVGILIAAAIVAVPYIVKDVALMYQGTDAQKSLVVGENYPVDGPYPAILKVSGISNGLYPVVNGDLFVTLPEGSKYPRITRFYDPGSINCKFYIEFTNAGGFRQTQTWPQCPTLKGLTVLPNEIYVK